MPKSSGSFCECKSKRKWEIPESSLWLKRKRREMYNGELASLATTTFFLFGYFLKSVPQCQSKANSGGWSNTFTLYSTRGPWTAMPALIKVDEIRTKLTKKIRYKNYSKLVQIFWEKAQCVCTLVKTGTKKALFSRHTTARWSHGPKWNPARIDAQTHLYLPRCHLSSLIQ